MLALLLSLFCVLANGFFVGAEFALAKVRPTALEALVKTQGDAKAKRALYITQNMNAYLSATQLGITLASLVLGRIGEPAVASILIPLLTPLHLSDETLHTVAATTGLSIIASLHIILGELVPKSLALSKTEALARYAALPLTLFYWASYPALIVLSSASRLTLRMLGLGHDVAHAEGALSLEELRLIIQSSVGEEDGTKKQLLERVLRATDRPIRAIMVPRVDMEFLSIDDNYEDWVQKIRRHGYSRYPVSRDDNPDRIVGYVYVKDLLMAAGTGFSTQKSKIATLKRDILIVPETRTVGDILSEFQRTKIPIALVVDEYGGTSGLVTLEDAVTEIVGELRDEVTGAESARIHKTAEGTWIVDGSLPLGDLEIEEADFPRMDHPDADTVSGFLVAELGRLASPGDSVQVGNFEMRVDDVRRRRVHRVSIRRIEQPDENI